MARIKDDHEGHNHSNFATYEKGLAKKLVDFNKELLEYFPETRYTSGKRTAGEGVGKNAKISRHNTGEAVDIGAENKEVYNFLTNDPRGVSLLYKYGLGVLDETSEEIMKATGATGAHFHIGSDSKLVAATKQRYEKLYANGVVSSLQNNDSENIVAIPLDIPVFKTFPGPQYAMTTPTGEIITPEMVYQTVEKEKIKEEKEQSSPERQEISATQMLVNEVKKKGLFQYYTEQPQEQVPQENTLPPAYSEDITQTPELSVPGSIFQMSKGGYKNDSPDKNNPVNIIDSPVITMENVSHPVLGIDDTGHTKLMMPEENYTFPGNRVLEIPIKNIS